MFADLPDLIATYGALLVGVVIMFESMGLPLPGESTLIAASIYAATTGRLSIAAVIAAGMLGAVVGDNLGYWIGRKAGFPLLVRYGPRVGIGPGRIKLAQYLFLRHGGKVVFFGRFIAVLRTLAALLAGATQMEWRRFLAWNIAAGIVWVGGYGMAAYLLGTQIHKLLGPAGLVGLAVGAAGLVFGFILLRRREAGLMAAAEQAFPGPLIPLPIPPREPRP